MCKLAFIVVAVLLTACRQPMRINARTLTDTLEILKKKADFRPLDSAEVYEFLNKYHLPRLDTMPTKRQIFVYPINGIDFKTRFQSDKSALEAKYSGDTSIKNIVPPIPPSIITDESITFNDKKLTGTKIIVDTLMTTKKPAAISYNTNRLKAWHKMFGYGYMCISYPQYNANTKILVLREWLVNYTSCGTGRERVFHYKRITGGWEAY